MIRNVTAVIVVIIATATFNLSTYAAELSPPLSQPLPELTAVTVQAAAAPAATPATTLAQPTATTKAKDSAGDMDKINLNYLKGYLVDTGKLVASPIHWEAGDWLKLGLVLGVTSSLFLVDQKIKDFSQEHKNSVLSGFASVGNALGDPLYTLPPVGAFYLYGQLADDPKARRTSLLAVESLAITSVMTSGLKVLAKRHRPSTGDSPTTWDGPNFSLKNLSFCSGHTSSAFSIATVFAEEYKDNAYIPPLAYGLATLTGLSRIYSNAHWASDAFFGAALGYFVSKGLLSLHKEEKGKKANKFMLLPEISKDMTGLSVKYDF